MGIEASGTRIVASRFTDNETKAGKECWCFWVLFDVCQEGCDHITQAGDQWHCVPYDKYFDDVEFKNTEPLDVMELFGKET